MSFRGFSTTAASSELLDGGLGIWGWLVPTLAGENLARADADAARVRALASGPVVAPRQGSARTCLSLETATSTSRNFQATAFKLASAETSRLIWKEHESHE
jgi:hypothetical protein